MTVGEALARAEELRPGCQITARTRQRWLVELDGMLREKFFKNCPAGSYDAVGADRAGNDKLAEDAELLAPAPFDALYPHYLCARIDAALGETARYAGEQSQYNALAIELAVWLRQQYPPRAGARWRW